MSGMKQGLFKAAIQRSNEGRPPVWFMRQAGRYHSHYQALRKRFSFIELCKKPEVACEATMGPINDFGFDAAILFSDLLFPLEVMGMGLSYDDGPELAWHLRDKADLSRLQGGAELADQLVFQAHAIELIRKELAPEKGLLGFVGGPLTLFFYAVEGSHQGELGSAKAGLRDGRFEGFCEKLTELLAQNMALQARAGVDTVAMLDTCAGEISPEDYRDIAVPAIGRVLRRFHELCPGFPITYYSKGTSAIYWENLRDLPISAIGVDWKHDIAAVLDRFSDRFAIQGNVDPQALFMPEGDIELLLRGVFERVLKLPAQKRRGWICGLGHGVLPKTPESSVRLFLKIQKEMFKS